MLSDRPYMRGDYQRERTSVLTWMLSALVAAFIVQLVVAPPWSGQTANFAGVSLTPGALNRGWLWTLLTHSFLHNTNLLFHIVGTVVGLYLLGRELLPMLGAKRFLALYAAATIVGGLAWSAVHWQTGGQLMGATSAVAALFIVFACFFPHQELNFLLFFLFPVTLKPKQVALGLVALELLALVFWEIPALELPYGVTIASSAHLGGMLTGFLFYRFLFDTHWFGQSSADAEIELPRWLRRAPKALPPPPAELATPPSPEVLRAEVDRILDKINSDGFAALTPAEKQVLAEARDQLSRP